MIYLDYAATTPMSKQACDIYTTVATRYFGNASSLHTKGDEAFELVEQSRATLSTILNVAKEGIYFTSGGTESNQLAIRSIAYGQKHRGNHLITTCCEHASVKNTFKQLQQEGFDITFLPVDCYGRINLEKLMSSITEKTTLVSIAFGNGEIGTLQPIAEIGALLREKGVIFHCDCVQAFGKVPIDIEALKIDSFSISSHKVYGPKGVGACYIHPRISIQSQHPGSTHESGFRSGTVNTPGVVAFVTAAEETCKALPETTKQFHSYQRQLQQQLEQAQIEFCIEGDRVHRFPHLVGIRFFGIEGQRMMLEASKHGVYFSTSSACQSRQQNPSDTLIAIGRTKEEADELIRLSFGKMTTNEEIQQATELLIKIVRESK